MKNYQKILLAVDLSEESSVATETAQAIATALDSDLHIIHVFEPYSYGYLDTVVADISYAQEQTYNAAKEALNEFSNRYGIDKILRHLESGKPAKKINETAEFIKADLIVIGSHGQHGVELLLGATANSVLHGSKCDVLAVRI